MGRRRRIAATGLTMLALGSCSQESGSRPSTPARTPLSSRSPNDPPSPTTSVGASQASCPRDRFIVPACGVLWGTYPFSKSDDWVAAAGDAEQQAGRSFDLIHRYHDFSDAGENGRFPDRAESSLIGSGHIMHFGWSTDVWGHPAAHARWADVAAGRFDHVIDAQGARLVELERKFPHSPYFLDFDHEPEGRHTSGSPEEYVAAARRVHDRLVRSGVANVVWVWVIENDAEVAQPYYPGDQYVDWIGYDPYNWFTCGGHADTWRSFADTVAPSYHALHDATWHSAKPLMLAEYGSVEFPGATRKADWLMGIPDALATLPSLKALEYFDNGIQTPGCDWTVRSSPSSSDAFRSAGAAVRHPVAGARPS